MRPSSWRLQYLYKFYAFFWKKKKKITFHLSKPASISMCNKAQNNRNLISKRYIIPWSAQLLFQNCPHLYMNYAKQHNYIVTHKAPVLYFESSPAMHTYLYIYTHDSLATQSTFCLSRSLARWRAHLSRLYYRDEKRHRRVWTVLYETRRDFLDDINNGSRASERVSIASDEHIAGAATTTTTLAAVCSWERGKRERERERDGLEEIGISILLRECW